MGKLIIIIACGLITEGASATEWSVTSKSDDNIIYIDQDSIKKNSIRVIGESSFTLSGNNVAKYIDVIVKPTHLKVGLLKEQGKTYYSKEQWIISCPDNSYFRNAYINYDVKEKVLNSWQSQKDFLTRSDFSTAFPETVASNVVNSACTSYYLSVPSIIEKMKNIDYYDQIEVGEFLKDYPSLTMAIGLIRLSRFSEDYANKYNVPTEEAMDKVMEMFRE